MVENCPDHGLASAFWALAPQIGREHADVPQEGL
jgi:hypothetical protein